MFIGPLIHSIVPQNAGMLLFFYKNISPTISSTHLGCAWVWGAAHKAAKGVQCLSGKKTALISPCSGDPIEKMCLYQIGATPPLVDGNAIGTHLGVWGGVGLAQTS